MFTTFFFYFILVWELKKEKVFLGVKDWIVRELIDFLFKFERRWGVIFEELSLLQVILPIWWLPNTSIASSCFLNEASTTFIDDCFKLIPIFVVVVVVSIDNLQLLLQLTTSSSCFILQLICQFISVLLILQKTLQLLQKKIVLIASYSYVINDFICQFISRQDNLL